MLGPTCLSRLMAGTGSFTRTFAVDVLPVPPFVELTVTELALSPAVLPVTLTLNEQLPAAASEPPLSETVSCAGALFAVVSVPPHCGDDPFATSKPAGRVSVKLIPVSAVEVFGLVIEKLSVVLLPVKMGFAVNDLAMAGGATTVNDDVP